MSYRVVSAEPSSPTGIAISSAMEEIEDALAFAFVLIEYDLEVLRIEDDAGAVVRDGDAVKAWCAARPKRRVERR